MLKQHVEVSDVLCLVRELFLHVAEREAVPKETQGSLQAAACM